MSLKQVFLAIALIFTQSCYDTSITGIDPSGLSIAVPLINTQFKLLEVANKTNNQSFFEVNQLGEITLVYKGQLVKNTAISLFPPIPGLIDFEIKSKSDVVNLPLPEGFDVDKGLFASSNITFLFQSSFSGDFCVEMTLTSIVKDGKQWSHNYTLKNDGSGTVVTESVSLEGWTANLSDNSINVEYEAFDKDGNEVILDYASFKLDIFHFTQVDGYFGNTSFDIKGDIIKVGLFNNWINGGIDFDNPKLTINVENSFGFPVRSNVNLLNFKTKSGVQFPLQSDFVTNGIDFNYPGLDESGEVKTTDFSFNKNNSNIKDLFKEKIVEVSYDIDAISNPDNDTSLINFIRDDSQFSVDINLELPLTFTIDKFTIQDTFELPLQINEEISEASILVNFHNEYPLSFKQQIYAIVNSTKVDSLFVEAIDIEENGQNIKEYPIRVSALRDDAIYINQIVVDQFSAGSLKQNVIVTEAHFLDLKMGLKLNY